MEQTVTVFDTETDGSNASTCRILEIAAIKFDIEKGPFTSATYSSFIHTDKEINPESSAGHHIISSDLEGAPLLAVVRKEFGEFCNQSVLCAFNSKFDFEVLQNNFGFEIPLTSGLCIMRLAQKMYSSLPQFNLSYLRYQLKLSLDCPRNERIAHTALDDAKIASLLLQETWKDYTKQQKAFKKEPSFEHFRNLCWEKNFITLCPFKKYKGIEWSKIPSDYINWCLNNVENLSEDLTFTLNKVLDGRR